MPQKIRNLIKSLENAGFINRGGKGSHRNFVHPRLKKPVTLSGNEYEDAKHYQEKSVTLAIVFQVMILSALSVGDIRQYDLLPLAFSKSLSEKL